MMDITVIAESTPGPIAINCATYTGYKQGGIGGAISATAGIVTPSFIVIYLISMFLDNFLEIHLIASCFKGISLAVGLLVLDAAFTMISKMKKKKLPRGIMAVSAAVMLLCNIFGWRVSSVTLMIAAAVFSLAIFLLKGKKGAGTK